MNRRINYTYLFEFVSNLPNVFGLQAARISNKVHPFQYKLLIARVGG